MAPSHEFRAESGGPVTAPPRNSAFYERKRRLAYVFACASLAFLLLDQSVGFFLELTSRPRAAAARDGGFRLVHRAINSDDADGSRLFTLNPDGRPAAPAVACSDPATAVLPEGGDTTVFFGSHAAKVVDGKVAGSLYLGRKWDVLAAADDPGGPWIFGWSENHVVARRREKETWGPDTVVSPSAPVDRIVAARDAASGLVVAWREEGGTRVKTALLSGIGFVPKEEFETGPVEHWDLVPAAGRRLLVLYNRDDRSFQYVTLRMQCCPGCPSPLEPRKVRLAEPLLLLGRRVTGLSTVASGDRLRFFITRMSTVTTASLPASTLQSEPAAARLVSIGGQPLWRHLAAGVPPFLLLFCSFSMIFLGIVLFRERGRLSGGIPVPGPPVADVSARVMAWLLDHLLLSPAMMLAGAVILPDADLFDLEDPRFRELVLVCLGMSFLYYAVLEWLFGWTIGKRILGLKVTGADGGRLTLRGALLRSVVRLLDSEALPMALAGMASLLITKRRQRLGDLLAGTIVVLDLPD